ncbi:ribonuclease P protein component 1 [Halosimplex pelagicum]|uniref:Ribonuclease P protein component 1 n=1 Tax=Halosimplex pelagicum TaxID=869886 RepID=A0A7D5SWI0_9EURY|nr:ribonuclease P protein component 1 [Halosimplex pelagicum]QLH83167.1 ribonuclease P protein component 1 [Halosimplex pelagicum]
MLTPETLTRHELVGLAARVRAGDNPDLLDIEGRVVAETTNTLGIERGDQPSGRTAGERATRVATVPKAGTTFEFTLPTEAGDASAGEVVTVEGRRLVARPARRTEKSGDSKWR